MVNLKIILNMIVFILINVNNSNNYCSWNH